MGQEWQRILQINNIQQAQNKYKSTQIKIELKKTKEKIFYKIGLRNTTFTSPTIAGGVGVNRTNYTAESMQRRGVPKPA